MRNTKKKACLAATLCLPLALALAACGKEEDDASKKKPAETGVTSPDTTTPTDPPVDLGPCRTKPKSTLWLLEDDALARDRAKVESLLHGRTPAGFTISIKDAYRNAAGVDASHFELTQEFGGIALCGYHAKAHVVAGEVTMPFFPYYTAPPNLGDAAFGTPEAAVDRAAGSMGLSGARTKVRTADRCLQPQGGELVPAFDVFATIGGAPYRVIGNGTAVFSVESQSLHAAATATVFKRNPTDAKMEDLPIDVSDTGTLDVANVRIVNATGTVIGPKAEGGKLAPAADSPAFLEVSLFAHVQEQLAYDLQFRTLGSTDCIPIEVLAHAGADEGPVYLPSWNQDTGHPRIVVPDAIPGLLQNLATDYDAVAHETNHHFVYQRLKSLSYEPSKVIHEGLADYFVFAHTGDTCLAESICPADTASKLCVVKGKCLREGDSAKSDMKFYTDKYLAEPSYHKKSQALSGLLIAIGREPTVGPDVIAKVMFAAIDFLKEKCEISDWLEAVLQGDKAVNAGVHACTIIDKAKEFGLVNETATMDCKTYQAK